MYSKWHFRHGISLIFTMVNGYSGEPEGGHLYIEQVGVCIYIIVVMRTTNLVLHNSYNSSSYLLCNQIESNTTNHCVSSEYQLVEAKHNWQKYWTHKNTNLLSNLFVLRGSYMFLFSLLYVTVCQLLCGFHKWNTILIDEHEFRKIIQNFNQLPFAVSPYEP